jgi:hypothetical protein
MTGSLRSMRLWWCAVSGAALIGLGLRVLAAQGGLWTDEAWSMIYAAQARDPAGVFLRINHDNNHHLYSLWLQAIGMRASPWLARLPAILCGTASIVVAALLVRRWSFTAGIVAALLFAIAPALVTFGAEARGYAPMLLAALVMLWLVARAVEQGWPRRLPWLLAAIAILGMFSQLTMAAPVTLLALWVYVERRAKVGPSAGMREAARLMGPAVAATAAVVLFVFAAAAASPTGMRLGGYAPFAWSDYESALDALSGWTLGISGAARWLGPLLIAGIAVLLAWRPPEWLGSRARLYALLILGVPVAIGLLHPGNAAFSRYYLSSGLGLLLLSSEWIGRGLEDSGGLRTLSASALAVVLIVSLWHDRDLIRAERGHPDAAVALMVQRSPGEARIALDPKRFEGMLTVAAARTGYSAHFVDGCAPAQFVVAARPRVTSPPATLVRCGVTFHAIGGDRGTPLSGDFWTLYGAPGGSERLQTAGAPVSGRLPGGPIRLSGRAGVAQG